jgi:hypothetical protein
MTDRFVEINKLIWYTPIKNNKIIGLLWPHLSFSSPGGEERPGTIASIGCINLAFQL